jgi:hypothetical protein
MLRYSVDEENVGGKAIEVKLITIIPLDFYFCVLTI